jgi:tight adherence protein B
VVAAAFCAILLPVPAHAAASASPRLVVSQVVVAPGTLRFLVTPTNLLPGTTVDPATIRVVAGQTELRTTSVPATDLTGAPTRTLTVVLDANGFAGSAYIGSAKAAAVALADIVPADVQLGLFAITAEPAQILAPTMDRTAFTQAVAGVRASGAINPAEGVAAAQRSLGPISSASERRLLLISDGRQAFSNTRAAEVGAAVAGSGLSLDVVTVGASGNGLTSLRNLAQAAGGRLLPATDQATATSQARESGRAFAATLSVTAVVPAELSGRSSTVSIEAAGFAPATTSTVFAPLPGGSLVAEPASLSWLPSWLIVVAALFLFAALVTIVLALAWPRSGNHDRIKQIAHFGPSRALPPAPKAEPASVSTGGRIARTALAASASVVRSGGMEDRIALGLERAGMKLRPHEWLLIRTLITAGSGVLFAFAGSWLGLLAGLLIGWIGTVLYQSVRISRRSRQFAEQLPDGLQLVIGSLRSGFSLSQSLESLVRESPEPLAAEVGRAVAEHRLGADLSEALDRLAQRNRSEDLSWAVIAVRIQREVGGNLAEVLQTTVDTMRERARLRRHVRSLSAEGRLSAWVLICVPLAVGGFMAVYRRSYLMPLVTDPRGLIMLIVGAILFVAGIVWMTRVINVEA